MRSTPTPARAGERQEADRRSAAPPACRAQNSQIWMAGAGIAIEPAVNGPVSVKPVVDKVVVVLQSPGIGATICRLTLHKHAWSPGIEIVRFCRRAIDSRRGWCRGCTGPWILALVDRSPGGGSDDPHSIPGVYRGTAGRCRFSPRMSLQVLLSCGSAGFSSVCRWLSSHVLVVFLGDEALGRLPETRCGYHQLGS